MLQGKLIKRIRNFVPSTRSASRRLKNFAEHESHRKSFESRHY
jgi:hypothetical protein